MSDRVFAQPIVVKNLFIENQYLYILLDDVRARVANLQSANTQALKNILMDLKFLVARGLNEALKIMADVLMTNTCDMSMQEKLKYLEQAAEFDANAAYYCGAAYLGFYDYPEGYKDPVKALRFLKQASYKSHSQAYFLLISAMLDGSIPVTEAKFLEVCNDLVEHGDLYAAIYYAAVLCGYPPPSVEDMVQLKIHKDLELAFNLINTAIYYAPKNKDLMHQTVNLIKKGFNDNIWPKEYVDSFLETFDWVSPTNLSARNQPRI